MNRTRVVCLVSAALVLLLLCVGLGWGPASTATHPEFLALLGLAVLGLVWPILMLRLAARSRLDK